MRAYLRRRRHVRAELARLALIDELFERVHAANPCPTPDCVAFRDEIHARSKQAVVED